ncbi:MAG: hypothetical protein RLY90_1300, partial [Pseudomonadota bacterium]
MSFEKLSSAELTKITNFLADLHQWEAENLACLNSISGRHIYFGMARQTVGQPSLISSSLKDLYMGGSMTERALRLRIRELEAEGFVKSVWWNKVHCCAPKRWPRPRVWWTACVRWKTWRIKSARHCRLC